MRNGRKRGLFLLLCFLSALVAVVYIGTEVFQVKRITVEGNREIKYQDIVRIAGIPIGQNVFKIERTQVRERIESNPYLKVLSIDFKYPDELIIRIQERSPAAAVWYLGSYVVIDVEGHVLEICKDIEDMPYPLVQGLSISGCTVGKRLAVADIYQLKALSRVLDGIYIQQLQEGISEILVENPDDIYIVSTNGTAIRLGQAVEVEKKLKWLRTPNFHQIDNGNVSGILDISVSTQAIFKPFEDEVSQ
jgi:cell division protein FtsQ